MVSGSTFILANADNWFSQVEIQNKTFTTKGMRRGLSKPRMSGCSPGTWVQIALKDMFYSRNKGNEWGGKTWKGESLGR